MAVTIMPRPRVVERLRVHRRPLPTWARPTLRALRHVHRAPMGAWRVLAPTVRWALDAERRRAIRTMQLQAAAGKSPHAAAFMSLLDGQRQHDRAVIALLALVTVGVVAVVLAARAVPPPVQVVAAAAIVVWLGWVGRPQVVRETSGPAEVPELRHDALSSALASLGIAPLRRAIETGRDPVRFPDLGRTADGWEIVADLPAGVTAQQVVDKREQLASALRRPLDTVWPATVPGEAPSRLHLLVTDAPLRRQTVVDHLLAVWPPDEEKVWCETLAARLAEQFPAYAGWTASSVSQAVKPYGIGTTQVWATTGQGEKKNRNGLVRRAVAEVAARG